MFYHNDGYNLRCLGKIFKYSIGKDGKRTIDRQNFYYGLKDIGSTISKKEAEVNSFRY